MAEHALSQRLMRHLKQHGHATRIENLAMSGMPDVTYCIRGCTGFIENKWIAAWPKLKPHERVVHCRHFTAQQRHWARQHAKAGGRCYVLLQVGTDYLLLEGAWAAANLGYRTRDELLAGALVVGQGEFPWPSILAVLLSR